MFNDVLNENNVKADNENRITYSPEEWLEVLVNQCFTKQKEMSQK